MGHNRGMALTIPVAHDFICPWCWVGLFQAKRLQEEFGVRVEWRGYELFPAGLDWPDYPAAKPQPSNKPATPSRLEFLLAAEGIVLPQIERPKKMRTYNAHQALEYAKTEGAGDAFNEALYRAYWERGEAINEIDVLKRLAHGLVHDIDAMVEAIRTKRFKKNVVDFDDDAYANGVYNVPTFFIGGERYAEQPYVVLRDAVLKAKQENGGTDVYSNLVFPKAPADRPYVYLNMVSTIDGKTVSGTRHDSVSDLGSKIDHLLMQRIERTADAVMVGAQTIRATTPAWNPKSPKRIAVTRSGNLPHEACFFLGGESYIATSGSSGVKPFGATKLIRAGGQQIDFELLLNRLRTSYGVQRLHCLGGSELNAELLRLDLVDELFLTIAPKIKLGRDLPTYAGGEPLPREALMRFELVENHVIGDEVFLRYRRGH